MSDSDDDRLAELGRQIRQDSVLYSGVDKEEKQVNRLVSFFLAIIACLIVTIIAMYMAGVFNGLN